MPIRSAMVDRARLLSPEPSTVKVEGRTQYSEITRQWFRCRVTIPPLPRSERPGGTGGAGKVDATPSMMFDVKDLDGEPVTLTFSDKVEVRSVEQGFDTVVFELAGDPQPIRKKRKVIGREVTLRMIRTATRERLP